MKPAIAEREKILSSVESLLRCIDRLAFYVFSPLLVLADNFSERMPERVIPLMEQELRWPSNDINPQRLGEVHLKTT